MKDKCGIAGLREWAPSMSKDSQHFSWTSNGDEKYSKEVLLMSHQGALRK